MRKGIADVVRVVGGGRDWLRKLVGGDWDMVFVFPGDLSEDFVEDTVNAKIEYRPEFYTSDNSGIVVFTKRGVVQRAVGFRPYPFDGNRAVYGPNVAVKPSPTHHLRFIDELA